MKNLLRKIAKEFDPRHDLKRLGKLPYRMEETAGKEGPFGVLKEGFYFFTNCIVKHFPRYGLPVAGVGGIRIFYCWEKSN